MTTEGLYKELLKYQALMELQRGMAELRASGGPPFPKSVEDAVSESVQAYKRAFERVPLILLSGGYYREDEPE